ncbi:unnamed protein product [Moneuplotes crassus]|uniref:60S ribosomal protein L34 n=1 Tax=Euplotes crassus TaxID=5936 RepID=A0AAD1XWD7_EUPCR|nr:unnamed protein product [Moneuplotes crassus]|mmetsp:Transcript_27819/g.27702  ORF Transcript_27819/g.27702 Transcript_27819/m.27702 type:complete len:144 (-) Transcript_27819:50-481(-)
MGRDNRVHYLRKQSWATKSNKFRKVKTPGRRITIQYTAKKCKGPQEGVTGLLPGPLAGIPHLRPGAFRRLNHNARTVSRPYGGVLSHRTVKDKIVRAFLIEEAKLLKRLMKEKAGKDSKPKKSKKKDAKKDAKKGKKGKKSKK